jgi:hypothetical protein
MELQPEMLAGESLLWAGPAIVECHLPSTRYLHGSVLPALRWVCYFLRTRRYRAASFVSTLGAGLLRLMGNPIRSHGSIHDLAALSLHRLEKSRILQSRVRHDPMGLEPSRRVGLFFPAVSSEVHEAETSWTSICRAPRFTAFQTPAASRLIQNQREQLQARIE